MIHQLLHGHAFGHRHRHGRGFGGGWGGPGGGGWGGGWGARARRGDVKYLVLELLAEGPKHGYEVINGIEERRGTRPSAGSVYPTLQMLEDGGFVTAESVEGKRVYTITTEGRAMLANRAPDETDEDDDAPNPRHRVKESAMKLGAAVMSARGSDDATLAKIREILDKARRDVYHLLASDEN